MVEGGRGLWPLGTVGRLRQAACSALRSFTVSIRTAWPLETCTARRGGYLGWLPGPREAWGGAHCTWSGRSSRRTSHVQLARRRGLDCKLGLGVPRRRCNSPLTTMQAYCHANPFKTSGAYVKHEDSTCSEQALCEEPQEHRARSQSCERWCQGTWDQRR